MSAPSEKPPTITSALAPDLDAVGKFIESMITKGAVAALVAAIVALLVKMRDLNSELMRKLASKSRKRPPSEAMRRLQMKLPFLCAAAAHDSKSMIPDDKKSKKRGAKTPTANARPELPAHLPRVPNVLLVPADKRICPTCDVEAKRVCIKTTAEKLDVRPSEYIETQVETCACPKCRHYIVTADKEDEVQASHEAHSTCFHSKRTPPHNLAPSQRGTRTQRIRRRNGLGGIRATRSHSVPCGQAKPCRSSAPPRRRHSPAPKRLGSGSHGTGLFADYLTLRRGRMGSGRRASA